MSLSKIKNQKYNQNQKKNKKQKQKKKKNKTKLKRQITNAFWMFFKNNNILKT